MKIQVNNLNFGYKNLAVLNINDATFEKGKAYGIVGKNGVGKTTFFKCLVNIITNYKGQVLIDGQDVRNNPQLLGKVGIVLDDMSLYKNRTGLFNLRYFIGLRGTFDEEKVMSLARELEIVDFLSYKVSKYSLGMVKKLHLLISLVDNAEILIFDEPFRGLDEQSVGWFRNYLLKLKNQGKTILISSHVQDDIEAISDVALLLEKGDFVREFDLNDASQEFQYMVVVNDIGEAVTILNALNMPYQQEEQKIYFTAFEDEYRVFFKKAIEQGIEFDQIKKELLINKLVK